MMTVHFTHKRERRPHAMTTHVFSLVVSNEQDEFHFHRTCNGSNRLLSHLTVWQIAKTALDAGSTFISVCEQKVRQRLPRKPLLLSLEGTFQQVWPTARRPCVTVPENNPEPIDELEKETPTRGPERSNVAPLVLLRPSGQPQRRRLGPRRHPMPHGLQEQSTSDELYESDDLTVDEDEKVDGFRKAPAKVAPEAAASVETHGGRRPSGSNERVMFGTGFISISLGTRTLDAHCEQCGLAANRSWMRFPRAKPHTCELKAGRLVCCWLC